MIKYAWDGSRTHTAVTAIGFFRRRRTRLWREVRNKLCGEQSARRHGGYVRARVAATLRRSATRWRTREADCRRADPRCA